MTNPIFPVKIHGKIDNHPEDEDDIFDDDKSPAEKAAADLRASRRRGYYPNSLIDKINSSFLSGVGSSVSSTPSLERAIKKKKVQSDSPNSRDSDKPLVTMSATQQVVYRKSQPHQFSSTKTLVERLYSSVLLILCRQFMSILTAKSEDKFVEHLRLLYPQLSNAADKSYLEMIREIPFQYDLENPVVKLKFQSELFQIVKHYDSLTISEEAKAVKISM